MSSGKTKKPRGCLQRPGKGGGFADHTSSSPGHVSQKGNPRRNEIQREGRGPRHFYSNFEDRQRLISDAAQGRGERNMISDREL